MLAIRADRTRGARQLPSSGALLVILGQRLDLGEDRVPDQPNERDAETVDVEKAAPGLAQEDDAQHHQPYAARLEISGAQLSKGHWSTHHFRIAPKVTPRSRCRRNRKVKIATGRRNRRVPAAIAVQSVIPDPSCEGM